MQLELLKQLRILYGFTQKELGELVDVKQCFISQLESGTKNPSKKTLKKLELVFSDCGLSESELLLINEVLKIRDKEGLFNFETGD
ncbi:helix-turn-helix domain-containing protein [Peribacillus frigoritolerans]|uniref:helix-turn-helix domain-containing protein n=1 Tax=Peribacillus frigoritolerans TaxID=450367 RepID=UPI003D352E6F